jgi:hypothetical protein
MHRNRRWLIVAIMLLAGLLAVGCARPAAPAAKAKPATTEAIPGSSLKTVILTEEAAKRIDLRTEPIRMEGGALIMPYDAIVYDKSGTTWAYAPVADKPFTYMRHSIDVGAIQGKAVRLNGGPPPGTHVVVVGSAELFGVEYGFMK